MIEPPEDASRELASIDLNLRINYGLIKDGPHPAVDREAVKAHIDELLEKRRAITRGADTPTTGET